MKSRKKGRMTYGQRVKWQAKKKPGRKPREIE